MSLKSMEFRLNLLQHVFIVLVYVAMIVRFLGMVNTSGASFFWWQLPGCLVMIVGLLFKHDNDNTAIEKIIKNRAQGREELITNGWYEFSRNPCYLGQMIILAGVFALAPSWWGTAAFVGYFLTANLTIRAEEKRLGELFGKQYDDYKLTVGRWFLTPTQLYVRYLLRS